ncbi:SurA N-terminal domain-containing protein [Microbulbifer sp. 2205BS26-8]|uniref:SurA N-terminal domain-containing protein n=1 Tax=Microbulbifer sp. 2205BS26-8 TaxID=3064386 RepID=UPI00273EDBEC|nr:SurA N-terminal domain-containing protein [Microbulbifer sp. 2205BS26-8]MDP5209980.1 SurA N-terminal domain-containing protein [Microbulbifer sp. 2205BS26-8]
MLQSMRDNLKGTAAIILAAFFGFIMVIGGIDFFTGASGGAADAVAEVNGEKITNLDLQRAIQNRRNMIMSQYGENVPADLISDQQLREPVLRQLVSSAVLRQAAQSSGMVMSTTTVNKAITEIPAFQVNGNFDPQLYRDALRRMGYNTANFPQVIESDLALQQYADSVTGSAFTTEVDAKQIVAASMEERDFDYVVMPVQALLAGIEVSDGEVEQYYQENQSQYQRPEQVAVEYIELTPSIFAANIDISEEDVRAQYDQEVASFGAERRRRAAHILLEDASQDKIAEIQGKLNAGEDFAQLAKTYSEDIGSRDEGGDLGFTTGDVFPKVFEETLASLEVGQVSSPVTTESGTHFIKLLEVEENEPPTFSERRSAIESQLRSVAAEQEFVDALSRLSDLAYNAEELSGPAEELGVPLQSSDLFSRTSGTGVLADSQVVDAAFSPEVKEDGNTSDVLNLTNEHSLVLRVTESQAAGTYPLEEVREQIVERLKRDKASAQLVQQAQALKEKLTEGEDFAELAKDQGLTFETSDKTRRGGFGERGEINNKAFSLPAPLGGATRLVVFATDNGDQVILKLRHVRSGSLSQQNKEQRQALMQQLASVTGGAELAAVQRYLSDQAKVELFTSGE